MLEVDETNNDAASASALITVDALSIEEGLDIDGSAGFAADYYKAVFPAINTDTVWQTVDLSWAESPDVEVVETSAKWFAAAGAIGALGEDAIKTSALPAGAAASLLFRMDQPRLIRFQAQANTTANSNYLFFGANGIELRPEGGENSRLSGSSTDWVTRYYVAPADAPIGFTYVQLQRAGRRNLFMSMTLRLVIR